MKKIALFVFAQCFGIFAFALPQPTQQSFNTVKPHALGRQALPSTSAEVRSSYRNNGSVNRPLMQNNGVKSRYRQTISADKLRAIQLRARSAKRTQIDAPVNLSR